MVRVKEIVVFGGVIDMTGGISVGSCRLAVNECIEAIEDETRPASLCRKTPETYDGLPVHFEGVVFPAREVGEVLQGPRPCIGVCELVEGRR